MSLRHQAQTLGRPLVRAARPTASVGKASPSWHRSSTRSLNSNSTSTKTHGGSAGFSRSTYFAAGVSALLLASLAQAAWSSPLALEAGTQPVQKIDRLVQPEELAKHTTASSCWVVVDGVVWDVTKFLQSHPGGADNLIENAGKDVSSIFKQLHPAGTLKKVEDHITKIGTIPMGALIPKADSLDSDEVQERRASLFAPDLLVNLSEFEEQAKYVLGETSAGWVYFNSWADDGQSFKNNRSGYSYIRFLPRVNVPVHDIESVTTFLGNGQEVPLPIFMAPTGGSALAHPEGELNLTRAASKTMIPQCVSSVASKGIFEVLRERDDIVAAGGKKAPIWFQLYVQRDRKASEDILHKLVGKDVGAIFITVDTPVLGNRESHAFDARRRAIENGTAQQRGEQDFTIQSSLGRQTLFDSDLTWADIAWVKKHCPNTPVIVKGISTVADVALAKEHGADGVVLSNHGARQLDHTPPPIATLVRLHREIPALLKDDKFDVYIDGGVTRGTDVLKAICLGARGVGIGRTMLYAQACYGEEGILRATAIFADEIHRGMRLLGAKKISDLKPEMLEVMDGLLGTQERN